jgi:hypothetical protein
MLGRAKRQLRVERLEERVLLATSAVPYATPLASDPTAHSGASVSKSYPSPAQISSNPSAEYAAGGDSDGSSSPATQEVVGPQLPMSSMKGGNANSYATSADSTYARYDNSDSSKDYLDKKETYQEKPASMPSSAGTPQPHMDVAILVSAGRATAQSGLASASPLMSAAAATQASTPAKLEPASPTGTGESAVAGVDTQGASATKDAPSSRPLEEDGADESAKQNTLQDDATSEALSAVSEQPPLLPQAITVLAGLAPLDLRAVEEGMQGIARRIEAIGKEAADAALGSGWAPWLAAGLVAAAAFEVALWRATSGSARSAFAVNGWKSSTWTWLPGRSEPPWLENP